MDPSDKVGTQQASMREKWKKVNGLKTLTGGHNLVNVKTENFKKM
jgi:hypothetical protein